MFSSYASFFKVLLLLLIEARYIWGYVEICHSKYPLIIAVFISCLVFSSFCFSIYYYSLNKASPSMQYNLLRLTIVDPIPKDKHKKARAKILKLLAPSNIWSPRIAGSASTGLIYPLFLIFLIG